MNFLLLAVVIVGVASQDPTGNPLVDVQIGAEAIHQMYEATFDNVRFYSSDILNDQNNELLNVALDAISSWSQVAQTITGEELSQVTCGCANCNGAATSCGCTSCGCNAQATTGCGCANCNSAANQDPSITQEATSDCNAAATSCGCTSCGCNAGNSNAEATTGCGCVNCANQDPTNTVEGVTSSCGCGNCNAASSCGCTSCGCNAGNSNAEASTGCGCANCNSAAHQDPTNTVEGVTSSCGCGNCNAASSCGCTSCGCTSGTCGGSAAADQDDQPSNCGPANEDGVTSSCGCGNCNVASSCGCTSCGCTSCGGGCNAAQSGGCGVVNVELTEDNNDQTTTDVEVVEQRNCNCQPRCITPPTGPVPVEDLIKKRIDMFYTEEIGREVQSCINNARTLLMSRQEAILEAIEIGRYRSTELQLKAVHGLLDFNLLLDFDNYYDTMTPLIYEYYNYLVNEIDPQLEILVGELEYNREMLTVQMRSCLQDITGKK